jgi:hypothetical protein
LLFLVVASSQGKGKQDKEDVDSHDVCAINSANITSWGKVLLKY